MNLTWRQAGPIALVVFAVSIGLTLNAPKTVALLAWLIPLGVAFFGVAFLTVRGGGWKSPSGAFISLMFGFLFCYLLLIFYAVAQQIRLEESHLHDLLRTVYGLIMGSAIMAAVTFPWNRPQRADARTAALDERSVQQDIRGVQLDRRGYGQDERAKLLTRRTFDIDTRSDSIGKREGVQQARDEEGQ